MCWTPIFNQTWLIVSWNQFCRFPFFTYPTNFLWRLKPYHIHSFWWLVFKPNALMWSFIFVTSTTLQPTCIVRSVTYGTTWLISNICHSRVQYYTIHNSKLIGYHKSWKYFTNNKYFNRDCDSARRVSCDSRAIINK